MKTMKRIVWVSLIAVLVLGCSSGPKAKVVELESKGTLMNLPTPDWVTTYTASGISAVQAQYKDKYCVIGMESGVNRQFVLAWADNFSAQQQLGAMVRTNIASKYQAVAKGSAQSSGGANSSSAEGAGSGDYQQRIDNFINSMVNVSYSGAQREADWWILSRRYDPDQKDLYTDSYTAYVLYTIPKSQLNDQVTGALKNSVSRDMDLYDITIKVAEEIMLNGFTTLGEAE
jgi:hypothetical protein